MNTQIVRLIFCLIISIALGNKIVAQTNFQAKIDSSKVLIGDPVTLQLTISDIPANAQYYINPINDQLKGLEIIEKAVADTQRNKEGFNISQKLIIAAYDSGTFTIPEIKVDIINQGAQKITLVSTPIMIQVRTLDVDTTQPYMPIKANLEAPIFWYEKWYVWAIIIGTLLVVGFIFYLLKKKKPQSPLQQKISLPLHELTLQQLKALEQQQLIAQGNAKLYYSELSEIIKNYIDKRFKLQTLEQTTAEVLQLSKRIAGLKKQRTELKLILRTADLVKFAKAQPDAQAMQQAMDAAVKLVVQTKEQQQQEVTHG